jgi:hypothetical protein
MEKTMARKPKSGTPLSTVAALEYVRTEIKEMETHSADGHMVLVQKADVLEIEIVQDWIEYCLNPDRTTLATRRQRQCDNRSDMGHPARRIPDAGKLAHDKPQR